MSAPLTKARSKWRRVVRDDVVFAERNVSDGTLFVMIASEPFDGSLPLLHLSISFRDHKQRLSRYPKWDEIIEARESLLPHDLPFKMLLPPLDEYVSAHDTTFHLWQGR